MLSLLAFASCQKEDVADSPEDMPAPLAIQGGGINADVRDGNSCKCEYQIVEVNNSTPPAGHSFQFLVSPTETCSTSINCTYFTFLEAEAACTFVFGQSPGCYNLESPGSTKPSAWYPFNCQIPGYSTISPAVVQEQFWKPNCVPSDLQTPSGNIKIRIRCSDAPPPPVACGLGSSYVSGIITLPIEGQDANTPVPVTLGGCGCQFLQ